jgi:peptide/nickel transport system permease protein
MKGIWRTFAEIKRYPSAVFGLVIIAALIGISIYAIVTIPYREAIRLWRGGEEVWYRYPRLAQPVWTNWFTSVDLPETIIRNSREQPELKVIEQVSPTLTEVYIPFTFEYNYEGFPQELSIFFRSRFQDTLPHVSVRWITPDGRDIRMGDFSVRASETYRIALDERLRRRLGNVVPQRGLFADPDNPEQALQGTYEVQITALLFEEDSDLEAEFILYGQVHGIAGTDHRRRDLTVALLWGTPIALSFGLLAAIGTQVSTMFIAAIGVWFRGWVDDVIQRVTEVNLILPLLPILIMVGTFYNRSIWVMLGVLIALNIFGAGIKTYRAIFLQVKESPYIEAAQAYGAGNGRIIFHYLIPRIVPVMIPNLVTLIPAFVFIEASLAVLGLGDPILPTWGKLIDDARAQGALFQGHYYWMLEPAVALMITGFAFAMVGFALDRIFNPKLRGL